MSSVEINNGNIIIDGEKQQIISGAFHYFRIHPDLWDDRLDKAVAFGLNTIETYVAWNLHEPHQGEFNFSGICDLEKFIDKVAERNLKLILRPGPYICAEHDNGGFPAWLIALDNVELRRMNKPYLDAVKNFFDELLPRMIERQYTHNGPIIMMQVENEYGSYSHDKEYLHYLYNLMLEYGFDIPLFTSDGPSQHYILGGTIPEATMTLNFGSKSQEAWRVGREFRANGPDFCMEFWNGWFDHWGKEHHTRDAKEVAEELDAMLSAGASVNFYMAHGGTNFGFNNGANGTFFDDYAATVTSYDYDCPINEAGDPTEKFYLCQEVIKKHTANPNIKDIPCGKKIVIEPIELTQSSSLLENLSNIATQSGQAVTPPTMEKLGENFGFIHYSKVLEGPIDSIPLKLCNVNDYALIWLDGKFLGAKMRSDFRDEIEISIPKEGAKLDILVENCGRINYGIYVGKDFKGIVNGVTLMLQMQLNWQYNLLPMEDLSKLEFGNFNNSPATFHRGEFNLDELGDAFLKRPGTKGVVWINGFNLGRYWEIGPTETLYIPAPILKKGKNSILILELGNLNSNSVEFAPNLKLS